MSTNCFIFKSKDEGVKLLTIDDMKAYRFSLDNLWEAKEEFSILSDSLQLQITQSEMLIATNHNRYAQGNWKARVIVMKYSLQ
jgi:hypothetical protein